MAHRYTNVHVNFTVYNKQKGYTVNNSVTRLLIIRIRVVRGLGTVSSCGEHNFSQVATCILPSNQRYRIILMRKIYIVFFIRKIADKIYLCCCLWAFLTLSEESHSLSFCSICQRRQVRQRSADLLSMYLGYTLTRYQSSAHVEEALPMNGRAAGWHKLGAKLGPLGY